jgi:hypothetical protein
MPPTFLYLLLFVLWVAFACVVWIAAVLMLLTRRTRRFSRPLCFAMAGTFPFVLGYQLLAAPVASVVLLSGWGFWKLFEPDSSSLTKNPAVIAVSTGVAFIALGTMLMMSLAGVYDGWKSGWKYGEGRSFKEALYAAPTFNRLRGSVRLLRSRRMSNETSP